MRCITLASTKAYNGICRDFGDGCVSDREYGGSILVAQQDVRVSLWCSIALVFGIIAFALETACIIHRPRGKAAVGKFERNHRLRSNTGLNRVQTEQSISQSVSQSTNQSIRCDTIQCAIHARLTMLHSCHDQIMQQDLFVGVSTTLCTDAVVNCSTRNTIVQVVPYTRLFWPLESKTCA
jgi:hypothetical protein